MLQSFLDQFRSIFATMPLQSRIIAGLLVTAIVLALGFLVGGSTSPTTEYLLGGRTFSERDLDAAEIAFGNADLRGWERVGRQIKIPIESRSEFLKALENSASLPLSLRTSVQAAIDKSTPFESNEQRLARQLHGKTLDLARSIMIFPDIRTATVAYDQGERMGLSRLRPQAASVTIEPEGSQPLSRARVMQIKDMVRAAFAGMSIDDVVVTDTNGSTSFDLADDDDPLSRKRREEEQRFEQKIRSHLIDYGDIRVATFVDIDSTVATEKAVLGYDTQPTTLSETSRKREIETSRPMPGGVPGVQTNALSNRPVKLDSTAQTSRTKEDERSSNRVAGKTYERTQVAGLAVKRVTVSIGLPNSFYQKAWVEKELQKNPGKSVDELDPLDTAKLVELKEETKTKIQQAVTALLPSVAVGEDKFPLVEVWDYIDLPDTAPEAPPATAIALTWLSESWQSVAMLALAAAALLIARSSIKSLGGNAEPTDFREGFGLELPTPPIVVDDDSDKVESMEITGGSLQQELVALVENNPEVAANVIRSWVGEAA